MVTLALGIPIGARISLKAVAHAGTNRVMAGGLVLVALLLLTLTQWTPTTETWVVSARSSSSPSAMAT